MIRDGATAFTELLAKHRLRELFIEELGWDHSHDEIHLPFSGTSYAFRALANKRGFLVLSSLVHRTVLANRGLLRHLQKQISRQFHEHIIVFYSEEPAKQVWQWSTVGADGKRRRHREHPFFSSDPPSSLISRLDMLRFSLEEEDSTTLIDAVTRVRTALDISPELELFSQYPSYALQSDALAVRMRDGDPEAFEEFVLFHMRLAKKSSRMLVRWVGLDEEDAMQVAMVGITEAARRFEPTKGYQFSTYASYWIRQQCQRYGVNQGMLIRFPGYIFWPAYRFEFEYFRLIATHGPRLSEEHLEAALEEAGLEPAHWETFCRARDYVTFSDLERHEYEEIRARPSSERQPLDILIEDEMVQFVLSEMVDLRERDCQILGARYGLVHKEMTLQECADRLDITRERVRQIQARGEEQLRRSLRINYPECFGKSVVRAGDTDP